MASFGIRRFARASSGQSLIEVAILAPVFALLICYAVDFGYMFLAAATLSAVSRDAAMYAIQGMTSPAQANPPSASSVANFAVAALGFSDASLSTTSIQVCSSAVGTASGNVAQCAWVGTATTSTYTADSDPESPAFQLNRVDLIYTVRPPVPMSFFNVSLLPSLTFHRAAEMRAMQ